MVHILCYRLKSIRSFHLVEREADWKEKISQALHDVMIIIKRLILCWLQKIYNMCISIPAYKTLFNMENVHLAKIPWIETSKCFGIVSE